MQQRPERGNAHGPYTMTLEVIMQGNTITGRLRRRFMAKVEKTDDCWNWTASKDRKGYGQIMVDYVPMGAHRASWLLHRGDLPPGMMVCHDCDNPGCVNPEHLFLGTAAANSADMVRKGRSTRGIKSANAKLNPDKVREIRRMCRAGMSQYEAGRVMGVSRSAIAHIMQGSRWSHVE